MHRNIYTTSVNLHNSLTGSIGTPVLLFCVSQCVASVFALTRNCLSVSEMGKRRFPANGEAPVV